MHKNLPIVLVFVLLALSLTAYLWQQSTLPNTKEEAIAQAQAYEPKAACTLAFVPAIHDATGALYTFPSGCLAPGWSHANDPQSDRQGEIIGDNPKNIPKNQLPICSFTGAGFENQPCLSPPGSLYQ